MSTPNPTPNAQINDALRDVLPEVELAKLRAGLGAPAREAAGLSRTRVALSWLAAEDSLPGLNTDLDVTTANPTLAEIMIMISTSWMFELLGTSASGDDCTYSAEGGILFTTDGADGDEVILLPHLNADLSPWTGTTWGTDQETEWECTIETGLAAVLANSIHWAGLKLTNTEVIATDNDQVYFRHEDVAGVSGNWVAVYSIGGTDVSVNTGIAIAASTIYHLAIKIDASRIARFYINDALVATSTALTDATDFIPYIGIAADGAAEAKTLVVYGQAISRTLGA